MPRMHSLELVPDAAGEAAVRADWQALRDAGLASMLDHAGATNTPHVTVIALPEISPDDEPHAVDLLGPLLPVEVVTSGVALRRPLGHAGAHVDVDDAVIRAVLDLRVRTTGHSTAVGCRT